MRSPLLLGCFLLALGLAAPAGGAEWMVVPGGPGLAAVLAQAADGDTVRVRGGSHPGPIRVEKALHLVGEGRPVLDGGGQGTVVVLAAPGTSLQGFVIRGSGLSLDEENSGVAVEAPRVRVADNQLEGALFGIYLRQAEGSEVIGNRITGAPLPLGRRGDAIRVWYSDGVTLEGNEVEGSRDVVLWYSSRLTVRGNQVLAGRYGLHFMYCDDASIAGNLLQDNSVGAFLMYSRRLRFHRNTVVGNRGPSGYGIGLKDMDDAEVRENAFTGNRAGVFLDNSPRELASSSGVTGNLFADNDIGVLLLPNVRRGDFRGNGFLNNGEQVGLAGAGGDPAANAWEENFWSDYGGYDADGDGFGDVPYRAERLFEKLMDRHPELRLLAGGPIVQALDFAAKSFPVIRPVPKLTDERPAVTPPRLEKLPPTRLGSGGGDLRTTAAGLLAGGLLLFAWPRILGGGRWRRRAAEPRPAPAGSGHGYGAGEIAIEARGLSCRYGSFIALAGADFTIRAGEAVALWGSNGAGKTTALRAMVGVIRCRGRLTVAGADPGREGKEVRRRVGFVPQEVSLEAGQTVSEALRFFARLRRVPPGEAEPLLARLGLESCAGKAVGSLSGGLRQRLALAIALLGDPPILLLDEATANLDDRSRLAFLELLRGLKEEGRTLVFSSHRRDEVAALADRVLHLENGKLLGSGAAEGFAAAPEPAAGPPPLEALPLAAACAGELPC